MSSLYKAFSGFLFFILLSACGVKGKPQPPLEGPVLGRGEITQIKKTKRPDTTKKKKPKVPENDWDEKDDFIEEAP